MDAQLARLDAVALADLVRTGELSPSELLDDTIARIEALNPSLNAVIHTSFDRAREAAAGDLPSGPFRGVPWLLKDLWPGEAGQPFHMGVRGLKEADHRATVDANLTTAYKRAGFVISGRTNTPEMGLAATTEPLAHGPTRNPWDTDRGPGGSSGGAAAAVASGMVPAANASDGGGSIRIPAAMCGLVGLKPSRGRVSMGPLQDEWGNSVQHAVTHTVRDSAAILDATAHPFPGDGVIAPTTGQPYADLVDGPTPRFRIGMLDRSTRPGIEIDPEVQTAVQEAAARLERLGHHVDQDHPAALDDQSGATAYGLLATASTAAALERLGGWIGRELTADDVEPATWLMAARGRQVTGAQVIAAEGQTMAFRRHVQQWWADGHDLLLAPTCLRAAPLLGEMQGTADDPMAGVDVTLAYSTLTAPFNTTGQPAISLPLARTTSGLPIGIQLVAAYGREDQLIQIAAQLERDVRWADARAPMHP